MHLLFDKTIFLLAAKDAGKLIGNFVFLTGFSSSLGFYIVYLYLFYDIYEFTLIKIVKQYVISE